MNSWLRLGAPVVVALIVIGLWQALVRAFDVPIYLVPAPTDVAQALARDWDLLSGSLWVTLEITGLALLAATVLGVLLAFLFVQSRVIEASLFPYAVLLQVTPIVAVAPLIIIWVKHTLVALTLCATIVAIFPIISNTVLGLRSIDPGLLDFFRLKRASRWQILWRLRLPSALPAFFGGLRIACGLALIGAVVAEFVAGTGGSQTGLAYQILQAGYQINIPRLFAALLLITLAGVVLFAAMTLLSRVVLRGWHEMR
ncbi:ABC transporter permease [Pigmentiphaga sp.]|uniref:ABC transporter permease n=1 Tax=Pigmentiphaga sp. TaxID=1977564 RepID=UPI00128E32E1|nr:ABC transporter permease [Pigmentiphaga sp.]MPS25394.1 ABC transporter permease [Alcaligenaceae bacterium SAGV5]MPS54008.1 ABC transporter permease [Alcaligenaceae bacterium SAGV3]MPT58957.1 ABC transporter permease [Alcaligenaceae bacterium]